MEIGAQYYLHSPGGVEMDDPRMFWVSITNAALGAVVLLFLLGFAYAVASESAAKLKRRFTHPAGLNRDPRRLSH